MAARGNLDEWVKQQRHQDSVRQVSAVLTNRVKKPKEGKKKVNQALQAARPKLTEDQAISV